MGQYYKPVCVKTREHVSSYKFFNGAKLMEHSWLGNTFVNAVESLLIEGGAWYKKSIVWAGDYADAEKNRKNNLYELCDKVLEPETGKVGKRYKYIVNHTKKQFIDKTKVIDNDGWKIHPLPLMTCDGNGRGGGDYHVDLTGKRGDYHLVGAWVRNSISIEKVKPIGYAEVIFDLTE